MDCVEGGSAVCAFEGENLIFVSRRFLDLLNLCDDDNAPVLHDQTGTGSCWPGQGSGETGRLEKLPNGIER